MRRLVLNRKEGTSLIIKVGEEVVAKILYDRFKGGAAKLVITAPEYVKIYREEILSRGIKNESNGDGVRGVHRV